MEPTNQSLESDIRALNRDISQLRTDSRELWNTTQRLRVTLEGENGQGGMQATVTKIAAKQEADSQVIRLAVWFPSIVSLISLIISLIALLR